MIVVAALILLAGIGVMVAGARTKRIGDTRRCTACTFELTGLETTTCPECGADLTRPRGVIVGTRRKRPVLLNAGRALSAIGLLLLPVGIWSSWSWSVIASHLPTSLVLVQARAGSGEAERAAAEVLL